MCHTRIGTFVKYIGYCYNKKLHPFTTDMGYANVLSKLEYNFIGSVESVESDEHFLTRQKHLTSLQNLILSEYIDPKRIDEMDVNQILKQRTKAWGKTKKTELSSFLNLMKLRWIVNQTQNLKELVRKNLTIF